MTHRDNPLPPTLAPPAPSPDLRRRVLTAARAAWSVGRAPDLWDRLWTNRTARLAWAAAVLALVVGNLALPGLHRDRPVAGALSVAAVAAGQDEVAELAELGRLTAELPGWELAVARRGGLTEGKESS
jgi:hypothetical protein